MNIKNISKLHLAIIATVLTAFGLMWFVNPLEPTPAIAHYNLWDQITGKADVIKAQAESDAVGQTANNLLYFWGTVVATFALAMIVPRLITLAAISGAFIGFLISYQYGEMSNGFFPIYGIVGGIIALWVVQLLFRFGGAIKDAASNRVAAFSKPVVRVNVPPTAPGHHVEMHPAA